ncbi:MAG: TRC40/GET3/ArsA family transport-energizing ATPase [Deltaproteobacteria bacterium]|nr:TRC40/GET3/ArsA family transport-energizing ATPase [Deltaproteobacteria bacterium]MBI4794386.1 TRC40/GET3/ArsA family transport-energizing ATPase [Deltaproteobacteria bacterium]
MENQITTNMREYLKNHPALKFLFFGGKGGVGKTVMAGATALWLASQGKRTLLASTNPVHSLSGLLDLEVFGHITPLPGIDNASAYEIDTRETIEKSKKDIRDKINWFLRFADLQLKADEFVDAATLNPAFEESAMFENMLDLMFGEEFDVYVFDTAPTANARRLLGMSKIYSLWVDKMVRSREEAKSLRQLLSFSKKEEADPLMDYLVDFRERMGHARELLTNPELTSFFFVTLPEALPIAVITRFLKWFHDFGIPVGGIVVNGLLPEGDPEKTPEFVRNRRAMQAEHMQTIWKLFDGDVRALVPLFETEIQGIAPLQRLAETLFA